MHLTISHRYFATPSFHYFHIWLNAPLRRAYRLPPYNTPYFTQSHETQIPNSYFSSTRHHPLSHPHSRFHIGYTRGLKNSMICDCDRECNTYNIMHTVQYTIPLLSDKWRSVFVGFRTLIKSISTPPAFQTGINILMEYDWLK